MRKAVKEAEIYKCEEIENIIFKNGFFKEDEFSCIYANDS